MLYGGEKVSKAEPRVHAYGTVDEMDALLGVIRSEKECTEELSGQLEGIQQKLFVLKSDLATPMSHREEISRVTQEDVEKVEKQIDDLESKVPQLQNFILPGGVRLGALLHQARTVCRRAERWTVKLSEGHDINYAVLRYLNRLGDFFFVLGRKVNADAGAPEVKAE